MASSGRTGSVEQRKSKQRKATGPRAQRACDSCRHRKERCDALQPCSPCSIAERTCRYTAQRKKRGLREGWVHSVEKLLALALTRSPHLESVLLSALSEGLRYPSKDDFAARWTDDAHPRSYLKSWRDSRLSRHLSSVLGNLDKLATGKSSELGHATEGVVENEQGSRSFLTPQLEPYLDPMSDVLQYGLQSNFEDQMSASTVDPAQKMPQIQEILQSSTDVSMRYDRQTQEKHQQPLIFADPKSATSHPEPRRKGHKTDNVTALSSVSKGVDMLSGVTLPSDSLELINNYFVRTHTWLPIIEKHRVLRTYYRCKERSDLLRMEEDTSVLLAILYSSQTHTFAPESVTVAQGKATEHMLHACRYLVSSDEEACHLSHAQALCVLAAACLQRQRIRTASILIAQADRIVGLVRNETEVPASSSQQEQLSRVTLACFCLDGILSAYLNLPISQTTPDTKDISVDGLEEWSPSGALFETSTPTSVSAPSFCLSTFNELGHAVQALNAARGLETVTNTKGVTGDDQIFASYFQLDESLNGHMMPHQLTVRLLYMIAWLIRRTGCSSFDLNGISDIHEKSKSFCYTFAKIAHGFEKNSISPLWPSLWTIVLDHIIAQREHDLPEGFSNVLIAIHEVATALVSINPMQGFQTLLSRVQAIIPDQIDISVSMDFTSQPKRSIPGELHEQGQMNIDTTISLNNYGAVPTMNDTLTDPTIDFGDGFSDMSAAAADAIVMEATDW